MQIKLAQDEYVNKFSGTIGQSFGSQAKPLVASLQIETNSKTYGPYGKRNPGDDPFSIPLPENVSIVGFFGRAGNLLDAIGFYIGYPRRPIPMSIIPNATGETSGKKDEEKTSLPPVTITGQVLCIVITCLPTTLLEHSISLFILSFICASFSLEKKLIHLKITDPSYQDWNVGWG